MQYRVLSLPILNVFLCICTSEGCILVSFNVTFVEKFGEKIEVRAIHEEGSNESALMQSTSFVISIVVKTRDTDRYPYDHLHYLENGDPNGIKPFWLHFDSHEKVITIHNGVNHSIDWSKEKCRRCFLSKSNPCIHEYSNMVVPV